MIHLHNHIEVFAQISYKLNQFAKIGLKLKVHMEDRWKNLKFNTKETDKDYFFNNILQDTLFFNQSNINQSNR